MGIRIQVENFGDNKQSVRYSRVNKNYTYAMHMHQFVEIFILLEGDLELTVDGRTEQMHPNQGAVIFPYQAHKYYSKVKNNAIILLFSPSALYDFYRSIHGKQASSCVFDLAKSTVSSLNERILCSDNLAMYDLKGILYYLLGDFLKQCELVPAPKKASLPSGIMNYIINHISDEVTLDGLAKSLGYAPHYLSGVINSIFGMNFTKVVACVRVDKARRLLRDTEMPRADVCYECGFGSERSFHRQFKEIVGRTPEEYRKLIFGRPVDELLFVEDIND